MCEKASPLSPWRTGSLAKSDICARQHCTSSGGKSRQERQQISMAKAAHTWQCTIEPTKDIRQCTIPLCDTKQMQRSSHLRNCIFFLFGQKSRNKQMAICFFGKKTFQCKLQIVRTTRRISCFIARWGHIFRTTVGHIFARWHIFLRQTPFLCGTDIYALRNGPVDLAYQQRQCVISLSKTFIKKSSNFG